MFHKWGVPSIQCKIYLDQSTMGEIDGLSLILTILCPSDHTTTPLE